MKISPILVLVLVVVFFIAGAAGGIWYDGVQEGECRDACIFEFADKKEECDAIPEEDVADQNWCMIELLDSIQTCQLGCKGVF